MTVGVGPGNIPVMKNWDRDLFWRWPGDAASFRAVCDRVMKFDQERRTGAE